MLIENEFLLWRVIRSFAINVREILTSFTSVFVVIPRNFRFLLKNSDIKIFLRKSDKLSLIQYRKTLSQWQQPLVNEILQT